MIPTLVKVPPNCRGAEPVKMLPPLPSMCTHDTRVDEFRRRLKSALNHLQKETESHILEDLLQESSWSRNIRDDRVKVVELSHRLNVQTRFQSFPGDHKGDCKMELAYGKEDSPPRRKAPPSRWADPIPVKTALGTPRNRK